MFHFNKYYFFTTILTNAMILDARERLLFENALTICSLLEYSTFIGIALLDTAGEVTTRLQWVISCQAEKTRGNISQPSAVAVGMSVCPSFSLTIRHMTPPASAPPTTTVQTVVYLSNHHLYNTHHPPISPTFQ